MFKVKTEQFEGPLHLLLELIEQQKLDITRVSLAHVADDFLRHIEDNGTITLGSLSDFLLVASQLILLKSKALLPLFEFTEEEEEELEDLEERLIEYKRFKEVSSKIGQLLTQNKISFSRDEEVYSSAIFTPQNISTQEICSAYSRILQEIPTKEELAKQVMLEVISLEEKIGQLKTTLEKRMKIAFHETIEHAKDKIEVVVTFLAMLEMIKQKIVTVQQDELFGDIVLERVIQK